MPIKSYKCPSCGAPISFNPELNKFKCEYCLKEYTVEEIEKYNQEEVHGEGEFVSYHCNNCGATVVTDDTTTATFCYYCHSPVIISSRLKQFKPDKMIPFSIDKETARKKFLDWAGKKKFVPDDFYSESQLEKITGIYLPYWWANCKLDFDYVGEGINIRVWRVGDREYTETKKYEIVRKGNVDVNNIGELAFTKIDKSLLDGIQPYNEKEVKKFSIPYLSGFFAEQYDVEKEKVAPKIEEKIKSYARNVIDQSISGYSTVREKKKDFRMSIKNWSYTLLPAWILTYIYKGKTYVYAVNGQTGKSFGELPFCKEKALKASGIVFAITFVILLLGGWLIW